MQDQLLQRAGDCVNAGLDCPIFPACNREVDLAASRGAELARRLGRESLAAEWEGWANRYRDVILERAYNAELGYFTQVLDGTFPDA